LADAHGSGPCTRKGVGVRVPSSAPDSFSSIISLLVTHFGVLEFSGLVSLGVLKCPALVFHPRNFLREIF
jgi:hypothetical protein